MDKHYKTIDLPNGGNIYLDKLAYECYQGICASNHKVNNKQVWKYTIDFEDNVVEKADRPIAINTLVETR